MYYVAPSPPPRVAALASQDRASLVCTLYMTCIISLYNLNRNYILGTLVAAALKQQAALAAFRDERHHRLPRLKSVVPGLKVYSLSSASRAVTGLL